VSAGGESALGAREVCFTARVLFEGPLDAGAEGPPGFRAAVHAARIPDALAQRTAESAWYWPEAGDALARHAWHVEVGLCAEVGTAVERALALTRELARLAARPGCVAVVWEATQLAHEPAQWVTQSEDATLDDLPLFLWLAFEGTEGPDGTRSLRTRGARDFGVREVEVAASKRDGEELLETVCDVALYVMTSPVPLEDGDQVEITRGKVRVRIEPSLRNDGTRAYRLRLP
jgi:hypothetical protein